MKMLVRNACLMLCAYLFAGLINKPDKDPPGVIISNGILNARLYLPDAHNGYYRGTRFDWAGVISTLEYNGHHYHGKWFDSYHPTNHDAIMGPVEEFFPLGYSEAKAGETFVKVGVGSLIKPTERQYSYSKLYTIADPGKWKIEKKSNQVQFTHTLAADHYAYVYSKTVVLTKGKPEMVLLHTLTNKGKRAIETTVYNHNFFVIDSQPAGPGYTIGFPLESLSAVGSKGDGEVVKLQGNQIVFLRNVNKGEQGYFPDLSAGVVMPYKIKVENTKTGAGVNITGDQPIAKMVFWSSSTNVSPEPYINVKVEPGKKFSWKIAYEYYTLPGKQ